MLGLISFGFKRLGEEPMGKGRNWFQGGRDTEETEGYVVLWQYIYIMLILICSDLMDYWWLIYGWWFIKSQPFSPHCPPHWSDNLNKSLVSAVLKLRPWRSQIIVKNNQKIYLHTNENHIIYEKQEITKRF